MKNRIFIYIIALISYIFVNILSMTKYPFVHSDETWLAGLSKTIMDNSTFKITEPFFDLYPRQPHAIKSLFHALQGVWISLFGYTPFSVRMLSFLIAVITLITLFVYLQKKEASRVHGFLFTCMLAMSIQFIYASHFGRQEIFILLFMLMNYIWIDVKLKKAVHRSDQIRTAFVSSLLTGIAIGFHPNSFLIACVVGLILLFDAIQNRRVLSILTYVINTGLIAGFYIIVSIKWNSGFLYDYKSFGDSLGATLTISEKFQTFPIFLYKLYHGISATYHTPNIRLELILLGIMVIVSILSLVFSSNEKLKRSIVNPLLACIGLTGGLILIGRYNATSIVFYLPFLVLLLHAALTHTPIGNHYKSVVLVVIVVLLSLNSGQTVFKPQLESYEAYTSNFEKYIPEDAKVLCNLNAGFALSPNQFFDYRNMAYLDHYNLSVETYLIQNEIEYVVLSEEMDYINRNQDSWDILYGSMDYYDAFKQVLSEDYILTHEFSSPQYGMRIVKYNDGYPWNVQIYQKK